jgi:lysine-N-methylase
MLFQPREWPAGNDHRFRCYAQSVQPARLLQPRHFDTFHCIGSDCEDTCCVGWLVHVDKATYEKYQTFSDPKWGPALRTLTTINENASGDDDYAKIIFNGAACSFLSGGLCSIQHTLGESYLPNMCATYPRVMNRVDDVLQRSLDLSCPEAARVALLDPLPMEFDEQEYVDGSIRHATYPALDLAGLKDSPEPYLFFRGLRRLVISVLQNRSQPIWRRLFRLGCLFEKLNEIDSRDKDSTRLKVLQQYADSLDDNTPGEPVPALARPAEQLEVVLELIVARISTDFNPRSFLDCYKQFMDGLQWTSISTMGEIGARYAEAYAQYYAPFMSRHEHILEHYLVNYAHRTLLPLGLPESNQRLANARVPSLVSAQYMLMVAYYAITQTLLIGMAGFHKDAFGAEQVIRLIQTGSKTFEHSLTYPGRVIDMLAGKALISPAALCVLTRN